MVFKDADSNVSSKELYDQVLPNIHIDECPSETLNSVVSRSSSLQYKFSNKKNFIHSQSRKVEEG